MSGAITHSQVRRQLVAMAGEYFDIGILRPDGRMLLREAWTVGKIEEAIQRLRRENARGAHIFVRPHGAHAFSLIDDLSVAAIARMTNAGFQPALVVETSPQNFQVWLNHRTNSRSQHQHSGREGTREAIRWRPLERGLETFRSTRGLHKSKTRKAVAERIGTIRSPARV